jgi:DNA-binding NarL/FixJ family response regulator
MLVGRSDETAAIDALLAQARDGRSAVLVVRGEAGIGKSSLLAYARERAGGFTVLGGTGIESESELPYGALHQILRPVLDRIELLPEPQAASLRAAFALSTETVDDRFRVSLGALTILAEAAEETAVLCVVDDAQWLDQASADALLFVARRLDAERIALLFAARDDERRAFPARGLDELRLSSLTAADSRTLLADRVGSGLAPGVADRLVESANGNPLALLELPGMLTDRQLGGYEPFTGNLAATTSVEQLYLERAASLSAAARALLVLAAAEGTGARPAVERAAAELGLDMRELAAAESAGLVRVAGDELEFRHPLIRSAVYRGASFTERERAHQALAAASAAGGNADRAAWHRAAATVGVDEDVARELEDTADRARQRSGYAAAAAALDRAAELSADAASAARRLVAGADAAWHAGQGERATAMLDRAVPSASDRLLGAELDNVRGMIGWRAGDLFGACTALVRAAEVIAARDPHEALLMLADAGCICLETGDYAQLAQIARHAGTLPRSDNEDDAFLTDLLVGVGSITGDVAAREVPLVADALARAGDVDEPGALIWAAVGASVIGSEAAETAILQRALTLARATAAVDRLITVLLTYATSGLLANRYGVVAEAAEGRKLAREAGLPNAANLHLAQLSWLAAVRGDEDECRASAAEAAEPARAKGHALAYSIAEWGVALLDLGAGRVDAAITRLTALSAAPAGAAHPYFVLNSAPDLVEACMRTGRLDEARAAFAPLAAFAGPGAPSWSLALAARCRALLAEDDGEAEFEEALRLHLEAKRPFDHARTELLYGEFLRRRRRRVEARMHLRAAVDAFDDIGAAPWAERARAELRASGESAQRHEAGGLADLTPQELQIARLVGEGASNKEVAGQLFLSPRTVEYHLRKVFMKLGISSRAELIRHAVTQAGDVPIAS